MDNELAARLAADADETRETHISWVFLKGDSAYKVKKPVALGFLDFSTLARRREACDAEVALNRRLAPDVYLGVVPVARGPDGAPRLGGDGGEVIDWAVHMRRMCDADRADVRLGERRLGVAEVDRLAARVAEFHAAATADEHAARFGTPDAIAANVRENFDQTRDRIGAVLGAREAAEIEAWQLAFLRERGELFAARIAQRRVKDGHGDLRLEHFYLPDDPAEEVRVLDCIEFNERFRFADVCADLAFLSMDLAYHGRVDLAERAIATYARESNDFELYRAIDFYESYRAFVRGKIATFTSDLAAARRYFLLALAKERRSLLGPAVVAIGGPIGSGKSTIADRLSAVLGAPVLNTDRVRKHLLGARPTDRLYEGSWAGAYDPAFTERVYDTSANWARAVLASGRPVVLDASFRSASMRAGARAVAAAADVPFWFVECRADPAILRARLAARDMSTSVSDGRPELLDDFLARWEPVQELAAREHVVLDTAQPLDECLERLRERIAVWPKGLTA